MTPEQKRLVQVSFGQLFRIADEAAAFFYGKLFELDPGLRPLFKADLKTQGRKLMDTLAYCVGKLDQPDMLLPQVRLLGQKHAGYGVTEGDYATVSQALLYTLRRGLGPTFTVEVEDAWRTLYAILAAAMTEGAGQPPQHATG